MLKFHVSPPFWHGSADEVREMFEKYGPVRDVYLPKDFYTGMAWCQYNRYLAYMGPPALPALLRPWPYMPLL